MNKRPGYSPEVRERAVRLVLTGEHEHKSRWAAIQSVAAKIGCTPETLRSWVNKMEVDAGKRPGTTSAEAARLKELERENRELKRANDILRKAAAFFAQAELDRSAARGARCRVNLRRVADCTVDLLPLQASGGQPGAALLPR